ncbi:RNA polymerase sigma-70 factor, ECF subfamily [Fontibacillus panacisegetis]|uniref:RNA polymerase sigma-70 factor, ECF subfamily n=1 Tax=Fontibacillus panacisegetis TaxID=670482 RepID=A0A1G7EJ22_9BACL|nr:sigma-70 family RNA polymerase sigma factor [Fontibacillus panacisegetis]SDE63628.1 RNA polymerase sigma-70 factor, ECF subfamily [Fontibacillus panacisegetis]
MNILSMDVLYREYKQDVYCYLMYLSRNHHDAEDLMQETFARACNKLEVNEGKKTKSWLLRVAHNAYIDKLRKESRSSAYENEFFYNYPSEDTPESDMVRQENRKELYKHLSLLSPNQQHAVLLYDIHGFSYQESADLMGVSLSHFKILLYRARQRLRSGKVSA